MPFASTRLGFRTKALALVGLAVAPWPLFALFGLAGLPFSLLGAAASIGAAAMLARLLGPIARTADDLKALVLADGADAHMFEQADAIVALARGVAHLKSRVHSLQHRWIWRHSLSGLPVREALVRAITDDLARDQPPTLLGAVRFADYNRLTAFDPATADKALKQFADRLVASLGRTRAVAHVDRDCFAIWFRGTQPEAAAIELRALCYALGAEIAAGDITLTPEIESGTAVFPGDAVEPTALINHALVSFARPGADRSDVQAPGQSATIARARFSLEQDLRHAIAREQLHMVFQPVVDVSRGLVGAEALLRWRHPETGMISPAHFIPILEDADLIDEIGRWTLNAACREARRWRQRGLDRLKVAINLSAAQLRDADLRQTIQRTLERHRLKPGALELELTETAATQDSERTFALFSELRALGISLAIDDFGSGYSSLSYLKNLPFDKLKIDREFVAGVDRQRDNQAICRSLIELTRGLGLEVQAEGVEHWREVETLRGFGCRIFQGYLFSRPLDPDQFIEFALDPQWQKPIAAPSPAVEPATRMSA